QHTRGGAGKMPVLQPREQIGFDQMLAAADLDQVAAAIHSRERLAVEDALGLRRQRQQVHENLVLAEHGIETCRAMKAAHAFWRRLFGSAPRHDWKAKQ